jgi:hypothetical protein
MDINSETIHSLPSAVYRETTIVPDDLVDPVAPIDVPRDIAVGHKRHAWAQQTLQGRGTCNPSRKIPREQETKEISELCFIHEPHH